jgi:KDO2-lipid IV(A) lauroyltransferase
LRRQVVERQIAAAFPHLDGAGVARIARRAYDSLGRTTIETAMLATLKGESVLSRVAQVNGWEHVEAAQAAGQGLVLVGGHHGNWELAGAYMAARGVKPDAIYFPAANKAFNAYMTAAREEIGMRIVTVWDAARVVPRALRDGHAVACMIDQALVGISASPVTFFGRPTFAPRGPAVFALRAGVPMLFVSYLRQPDGRFHIAYEPVPYVNTGQKEDDVDQMVAAYTAVLERQVREFPEQYFWHHKRWKRQPEGTPPELGDPSR